MAIDFPNSPTNGQEFTSGGTSWVYDGTKWSIKQATSYSNDSAPVGTVLNFAGPAGSIPAGWIACDGSAVSRSTYATLFSVIGTTYGSGNGSTTFNLPDIDSSTGVFIIRWTTTLGVTATDSLYTAPVGAMLNWPTASSYPTGWLRADGSAVSRTSYADLFILIGTTYGSGDGSTTFNLPNLVETGGPVTIIKATMSGGQPPSTVAHAASHIRGGTDILDGDRVQVDYVPSNYTRNSAATGAGATTDLTAHLGGIDASMLTLFNNTLCMTEGIDTSQSVANGTGVALQFNGADILDADNMHSTSTNNTRFVFPSNGIYQVNGGWAINASTNAMWCAIVQGGTIKAWNGSGSGSSHNGVAYAGCSTLIYATAGQYVELYGYQTNGSSAARVPYGGYMNIIKVRNA